MFATDRFKDFIVGVKVALETDHRLLVQILQTKYLDELTPRLQRMRMRLMYYSYSVVCVPGKQLVLADSVEKSDRKQGGKRN